MERLIRGVIDLDEKTKKMVEKKELSFDEEKAQLQERLSEMENDAREASRSEAKASYDAIYQRTMKEVSDIDDYNRERLERVDAIYRRHKDELVEEVFQFLDF